MKYIQDFAKAHDLLRHIKLGQSVVSAAYEGGHWRVKTQTGESYTCQFFVSAIGQLHVPSFPDFKGRQTFKGVSFHSAQWNHSVDLSGKNVGVIGVGASAAQLIPEVAKVARSLTVYQRTPNWMINKGDRPYTRFEKWIAKRVPSIARLYRFGLWCQGEFIVWPIIRGAKIRRKLAKLASLAEMKKYIKDPELRRQLTPTYPMGAKRILFSDSYYPALAKETVTLETDNIAEVYSAGIKTENGTQHHHDVLIYATGFYSNPFLKEIEVIGASGVSLKQH